MSVNFSIGHVVRTFPAGDGAFDALVITGFADEKLRVRNYDFPEYDEEIISRFKVEMFAFMGKNGFYELGDTVTVYGYEGAWKVEKFGQNPRSTEAEWCAALLHEDGKRRLFWPAHLLMKIT